MKEDSLIEKIRGLYSKKSSNFSTGEGKVHPIYEALAALLKEQVSDKDAEKRLIEEGEKGIKSVIIADGLLGMLSSCQREDIKSMFGSGKSLAEIINKASLYIADDKRAKDGFVLVRANSEKPNSCFRKALKKADVSLLYIETNELNKIKDRAEKIKKRIPKKILACLAIASMLTFSGFLYKSQLKKYHLSLSHYNSLKTQIPLFEADIKNKQSALGEMQSKVYTTEKNLEQTAEFYQSKLVEVSEIEKQISSKKYELSELAKEAKIKDINIYSTKSEIANKKSEISKLDEDIGKKKGELKSLEKEIEKAQQKLKPQEYSR